MVYVVPHLRYGSLIFMPGPEETKNGRIPKHMEQFTKLYNKTVKQLYKLPRSTANDLIYKLLGDWNAEAMYTQSFARNANLWYSKYEKEIRQNKLNILTKKVGEKYRDIQRRIGVREYFLLNKSMI